MVYDVPCCPLVPFAHSCSLETCLRSSAPSSETNIAGLSWAPPALARRGTLIPRQRQHGTHCCGVVSAGRCTLHTECHWHQVHTRRIWRVLSAPFICTAARDTPCVGRGVISGSTCRRAGGVRHVRSCGRLSRSGAALFERGNASVSTCMHKGEHCLSEGIQV